MEFNKNRNPAEKVKTSNIRKGESGVVGNQKKPGKASNNKKK